MTMPKLSTLGSVVAVLLIIFFGVMTWEMFFVRYGADSLAWARSMSIYSVIEAFALSAAGALMGVQIQSGRVRAAESRAEVKEKDADEAREAAREAKSELGGHLLTLQRARAQVNEMSALRERGGGGPVGGSDLEVLRRLLNPLE
jgi:hypothetical protein